MLWPDRPESRSRSALSTAIWRISKSVAEAGFSDALSIHGHDQSTLAVAIGSDVSFDCVELAASVEAASQELRISSILSESVRERLCRALAAWAGDFLEGSRSDWALREQERFRSIRVRGLTAMMHDCAARTAIEQALDHGREILAMDELRESTQREVMWLYMMNGQQRAAISLYKDLRARLREELAVEPMPETTALYQFIVESGNSPAPIDSAPIAVVLREFEMRRAEVYVAISAASNSSS